MPRLLIACSLLLWLAASAPAANLLTNGTLDNPGLHEQDIAVGWTLEEAPADNTATFATFADHTSLPNNNGVGVGLWLLAFEGTEVDDPRPAVNADLYQVVPAVPGLIYEMTGWARFEENWPGGFDLLPGDWPDDTPSPTVNEFALEFLDAGGTSLGGSVVVDLHDDRGQTNDNLWHLHTLTATAPPGTVNARVRASMIDGVNSDVNPQSAFVDDFSLRVVPEPSSLILAVLGAIGALWIYRRR